VNEMLGKNIPMETEPSEFLHDVPGEWFKGPF